jgi:hypothetical protein
MSKSQPSVKSATAGVRPIKTAKVFLAVPDKAIIKVFTSVLSASETLHNNIVKAARMIAIQSAKELDPASTVDARVDALSRCYKPQLDKIKQTGSAGVYTISTFKTALTLLLMPAETTVTFTTVSKVNPEVKTMLASDCVTELSTSNMKEAAKSVRKIIGTGRKTAPKVVNNPAAKKIDQKTADTEQQAFAAWLLNLPVYWKGHQTAIDMAFRELNLRIVATIR